MATVTEVKGHAPREPGAKMIISAVASWETIGGGNLEATVINRAREMLAAGTAAPEIVTFPLNEHAATEHGRQCCGGVASVLIEPIHAWPTVAIFGAGHVGHELARILSRLPIHLVLIDSRTSPLTADHLAEISAGTADVKALHSVVPDSALAALPKGAHIFIMTHDHSEDFLLCDAAIRKGDLGTIGLIGSKVKWSRFRQKLLAEGLDEAQINGITCPIGIANVSGKSPAAIAVSAAASLLQKLGKQVSHSE